MKILHNLGLSLIYMLMMTSTINLSFTGCSSDNNGSTGSEPLGPRVVVSPQPQLYFGQIPEGQETYRELKLTNSGDKTLIIPGLVIEGTDAGLFTLDNSSQIELGEIQSIVVGITFNPQTSGTFSAQVKIESNAGSSPDYHDLTAAGTAASGASITFERIIGGQENDGASSVRITHNGGFIVAGSTFDPDLEWTLATLTFLDKFGNVEWIEQYPGDGTSSFSSVVIADDGGFVAVGATASTNLTSTNVYMVKTDANGSIENEWTYGGTMADNALEIEKTLDGGYIVSGKTNNTGTTGDLLDALLIRLDGSFTQIWMKNYGIKSGNYQGENAHAVREAADGGFIFAGSQSTDDGTFNFYLVKTDADGNEQWAKTYGGADWDEARDVIISDEGGYVLIGYTVVNARDIFVVKTDSAGVEEWSQTYGGGRNDEGSAIIRTSDQGYLIVGGSKSFSENEDEDVYIVKTDDSGNQRWEKTIGGNGGESASCVREDAPNGYIISGSTASFSRSSDMYILKIDNSGQIGQ